MAHVTHFFVGHAVEQRAQLAHFVPDLLVIVVVHRITHFAGDQADNLPVALDVILRVDGFIEALEAAVSAGKDAAMLAPGSGGQQHVSLFGGFGHENILHHHEIERFEAVAHQP